MNRREYLLSAVSAATLAASTKTLARQADNGGVEPEPLSDVQISYGVKIPMRDGVELDATLYMPKQMERPRPAIFSLTPYIADHEHSDALALAEFGYPYFAVDVRGRGNSDGEFIPFFNDIDDGHDIVEWIAKQPYCNGKVGSRGLSYTGYTQWATVRGDPPSLATIVPSAPCWVGLDYPLRNNIFFTFLAPWMTRTLGNASRTNVYVDYEYFSKEYVNFLEAGLPFKELDKFFGFENEYFDEWMQHPYRDAYWDSANPTPEQFADLTIPVLSLCGAYDGDQPGTLEFYRHHLKNAGDKANHYLVIGPWGHIEVRYPKAEFMGIKVGPDAVIDMERLHRDWYAWTMEDGPKPEFLKKNVAYYVTDAEKWRYVDTLDQATARHETLYLQSLGNPTGVFNSGSLTPAKPAGDAEPGQYIYDPRDLSVPKFEATLTDGTLKDQRAVLADLGEKLIYHTAPFEEDQELSGFFELAAWIAIDQPDTDFKASIYEIAPDGSSLYLTEQHLRARYRESDREPVLIDTTEPLLYNFDRFFFVGRRVRKGHRLRLVFRANHSLGWEKNYNSDKPVNEQTMEDARTVTVRLFQDADHPSVLRMPIGRFNS